eukprot:2301225-Pyramimonas_sp.AAC.1
MVRTFRRCTTPGTTTNAMIASFFKTSFWPLSSGRQIHKEIWTFSMTNLGQLAATAGFQRSAAKCHTWNLTPLGSTHNSCPGIRRPNRPRAC